MPTITLSDAAAALFGQNLPGEILVTDDHRELVRAGLMIPLRTFAREREGAATLQLA